MAKLNDLVKSQTQPLEDGQLDPILEAAVESQPVQPNSAATVEPTQPEPTAPQAAPPPVSPTPAKPVTRAVLPPWVFVVGGGILTVLIAGFGGSFNAPKQSNAAPRANQPSSVPSAPDGRRIL